MIGEREIRRVGSERHRNKEEADGRQRRLSELHQLANCLRKYLADAQSNDVIKIDVAPTKSNLEQPSHAVLFVREPESEAA